MIYSDLRKLIALYEMIKHGDGQPSLQDFMDMVTRRTTQIMGVKACSIKISDTDGKSLRFASVYGLNEDYVAKGKIDIEKSGINREVLEGSLYSIGFIEDGKCFQYSEDVRSEGIVSMLCLPLRVDDRTFGVLCIYSGQAHHFRQADVSFFSLITDLIALAMDRLTRDKAKTWFMHKAAHQLRAPLNAVQGMLELLVGEYLGPINDRQRETVARCRKRLTILHSILNDLLDLAVGRQQIGAPLLRPLDPAAVLKSLAPVFQAVAEEKGVHIEFLIANGAHEILGEERMMDDLFANLISNAVKYTPRGGRVTVRLLSPDSRSILFEVEDSGIGVPISDRSRLFTEFFRAENAKDCGEEGTGLGLVIAKEIVDRLCGVIEVESQVGRGSRFSCRIPTVAEAEAEIST